MFRRTDTNEQLINLPITEKVVLILKYNSLPNVRIMDPHDHARKARELYKGICTVGEINAELGKVLSNPITPSLVVSGFTNLYDYQRGKVGICRWNGLKFVNTFGNFTIIQNVRNVTARNSAWFDKSVFYANGCYSQVRLYEKYTKSWNHDSIKSHGLNLLEFLCDDFLRGMLTLSADEKDQILFHDKMYQP